MSSRWTEDHREQKLDLFQYSNIGDLSPELESSEQFAWRNRRHGETETQLIRSAIMPSIQADSSQNEVS